MINRKAGKLKSQVSSCDALYSLSPVYADIEEAVSTGSRDEAAAWGAELHADADSLHSYTKTAKLTQTCQNIMGYTFNI